MLVRRLSIFVVTAFSTLACARSAVVQTALHGDLATLKREVKASHDRGDLDKRTVTDLAEAVAGREVRSSKGETAVERIKDVRPCARPLLPVLEDRAEQTDDAGAEATIALFELGKRNRLDLVKHHRDSTRGAWRAVAARAASDRAQGPMRRKLFLDPDERVRRGALQAAIEAASNDDLETLLEAARLDPDPQSRGLATRAVGAIGGERAVLALRDQWARADEPTRMTIVEAWSMPSAFVSGGEHELVTIAENKHGVEAISAADALFHSGGRNAKIGVAVLINAVKEGTEAERRLAIQIVPLSDPDGHKAVEKASEDKDKEVRVMALARLVSEKNHREAALKGLRELAKQNDDLGVQARAALAAAGDAGVKKQLTALLDAPKARNRTTAAKGLLDLGDWSNAALALADDDPAVRTAVACAVLTRER